MKVIGITGGIGSGKTSVSKFIIEAGFPVYFTDDRAKQIMNESDEIKNYLTKKYSNNIYINNLLNTKLLASYVFKDTKALNELNEIVHPKVFDDFEIWKNSQNKNLIFKESAILFESGSYKMCDFNISVEADEEIRIARTMKRNNFTREQVMDRIKKQWSSHQRLKKADYVIFNNDDLEKLKIETKNLLNFLNKKFNQS